LLAFWHYIEYNIIITNTKDTPMKTAQEIINELTEEKFDELIDGVEFQPSNNAASETGVSMIAFIHVPELDDEKLKVELEVKSGEEYDCEEIYSLDRLIK